MKKYEELTREERDQVYQEYLDIQSILPSLTGTADPEAKFLVNRYGEIQTILEGR